MFLVIYFFFQKFVFLTSEVKQMKLSIYTTRRRLFPRKILIKITNKNETVVSKDWLANERRTYVVARPITRENIASKASYINKFFFMCTCE